MVRALRRITVERGIDGRQCALIAFGGAGPMHAVEVARAFGIAQVLVPANSSMFSALGCVSAEMSYSQQRTLRMAVGDWDGARLDEARRTLRARLAAPLLAAGHGEDEMRVEEVASVRYSGQSYAIEIPGPAYGDPARLGADFLERHEKLYGFATDEPWELVAIRQRVFVPRPLSDSRSAPAGGGAGPTGTAPCSFGEGEAIPTPRHGRAGLQPDRAISGPAIIEDEWSTVVLPPGATLTPDGEGHLHIDTGAAK